MGGFFFKKKGNENENTKTQKHKKINKIDRDPNRGETYPGKLPDRHNLFFTRQITNCGSSGSYLSLV